MPIRPLTLNSFFSLNGGGSPKPDKFDCIKANDASFAPVTDHDGKPDTLILSALRVVFNLI